MLTLERRQARLRKNVLGELQFMLHHFNQMLKAAEKGNTALMVAGNHSRLSSFIPHLQQTIDQLHAPLPSEEALEKLELHLEKTLLPVKRRLEAQLRTSPNKGSHQAEAGSPSTTNRPPTSRSGELTSGSSSDDLTTSPSVPKRKLDDSLAADEDAEALSCMDAYFGVPAVPVKDEAQLKRHRSGVDVDMLGSSTTNGNEDDDDAVLAAAADLAGQTDDEDEPPVVTEASEASDASLPAPTLARPSMTRPKSEPRPGALTPPLVVADNHESDAGLSSVPRGGGGDGAATTPPERDAATTPPLRRSPSPTCPGSGLPPPSPSRPTLALSADEACGAPGKPATLALRRRASIQVLPKKVEYHCASCGEVYTSKSSCPYNPWWSLVRQACPKCNQRQFPWIDISSETNQITHHVADDDDDAAGLDDADPDAKAAARAAGLDGAENDDDDETKIAAEATGPAKHSAGDGSGPCASGDADDGALADDESRETRRDASHRDGDDDDKTGLQDGLGGLDRDRPSGALPPPPPGLGRRCVSAQATSTLVEDDLDADEAAFATEPVLSETASPTLDAQGTDGSSSPTADPSRRRRSVKRAFESTDPWRLTEAQASALLDLFHHARRCPGRHNSKPHADVCQAAKFVMLHVRDCQGTLPCGNHCPFAWCKALKRFLRHVLGCVDNDQASGCAVCRREAGRVVLDPDARPLAGIASSGGDSAPLGGTCPTCAADMESPDGCIHCGYARSNAWFAAAEAPPTPTDVHPPRGGRHQRPSFDYWDTLDRQHAASAAAADARVVG